MNLRVKVVSSTDEVDKENKKSSSNSKNEKMNRNSGEISVEDVANMFDGEIIETNPDIISNK
jgi:hypothetical protein